MSSSGPIDNGVTLVVSLVTKMKLNKGLTPEPVDYFRLNKDFHSHSKIILLYLGLRTHIKDSEVLVSEVLDSDSYKGYGLLISFSLMMQDSPISLILTNLKFLFLVILILNPVLG